MTKPLETDQVTKIQGGLARDDFYSIQQQILNDYGFDKLLMWCNEFYVSIVESFLYL